MVSSREVRHDETNKAALTGMDMKEQHAIVKLNKRRSEIAETAQRGFTVVIGANSLDAAIVREVHWLAKEAGAPLTVYMVAPTKPWVSALITPQAEQIKRLVARLDAQLVTITPKEAVEKITTDWRNALPLRVFFGPRRRWPWDIGVSRALFRQLTSFTKSSGVDATVDAPVPGDTWTHVVWRLDQHRPWYHDYVLSLFAVCIAALSVQWLKNLMPAENLSIVFLTAVIFSATAYGFAAALFASLISVGLFDFFFVSPTFSFSFSSPDNVLLVILFVLMSGITSNLAGRLRDQAEAAQQREGEARALFQLTRDVATSDTVEETYAAVVRQSALLFDAETIVLVPHQGPSDSDASKAASTLQPVYPPQSGLNQDHIEAARWAFAHNNPCGQGTDNFSVLDTFFRPLETANGVVGVLALSNFNSNMLVEDKARRMFDSVCRLSAVAVERARQSQELEDARVISQTESLRSALLSSISHDFGTPLASVIGSTSSLLTYGDRYTPEVTHELLTTVLEEAERLNKFVSNLMQMTRVESGALIPRLQLTDVDDLIGTTLDGAQRRLEKHDLYVEVAERLPLINIDFVLMETVLMNLLENACKYSPPETSISIMAYEKEEHVVIDVKDNGQGIPSEDLGAIFDKFFRVKARDRKIAGTGLGLAICKGILEGHNGSIEALSDGPGRGTTMRIQLPADVSDIAESA
ncbi:MAG: DUF4118 domain-containing protein [Alphaproteobacteria bacterium]|nr:DUF4118 domain-containing protein [Alphaproteobacteria bacterium]